MVFPLFQFGEIFQFSDRGVRTKLHSVLPHHEGDERDQVSPASGLPQKKLHYIWLF